MKTYLISFIALIISFTINAQDKPIKVVFDVTSKDVSVHDSTVRHIAFVSEAYKQSQFEIVIYSGALNMLLKNKSSNASKIAELIKKDNVSFVVCQGTMDRYKANKSELIEGVQIVPDGIYEIALKQSEGWSYIKEAH
jgi:hypothetical protein